jgi:hypothetical protein
MLEDDQQYSTVVMNGSVCYFCRFPGCDYAVWWSFSRKRDLSEVCHATFPQLSFLPFPNWTVFAVICTLSLVNLLVQTWSTNSTLQHMFRRYRPFKCRARRCKGDPGFTSWKGLLRHKRQHHFWRYTYKGT